MKKIVYVLALLCITQNNTQAAARRLATTALKAIATTSIIGGSGYCRTQTFQQVYETPRSSITLAPSVFIDPQKLPGFDTPRKNLCLDKDWSVESFSVRKNPAPGYSYSLAFTGTPEQIKAIKTLLRDRGLHPKKLYSHSQLADKNLVECVFYFPMSEASLFESMFLPS